MKRREWPDAVKTVCGEHPAFVDEAPEYVDPDMEVTRPEVAVPMAALVGVSR